MYEEYFHHRCQGAKFGSQERVVKSCSRPLLFSKKSFASTEFPPQQYINPTQGWHVCRCTNTFFLKGRERCPENWGSHLRPPFKEFPDLYKSPGVTNPPAVCKSVECVCLQNCYKENVLDYIIHLEVYFTINLWNAQISMFKLININVVAITLWEKSNYWRLIITYRTLFNK